MRKFSTKFYLIILNQLLRAFKKIWKILKNFWEKLAKNFQNINKFLKTFKNILQKF